MNSWNHRLLLALGDALSEGKDSRSPSEAGSVLPRPSAFLSWFCLFDGKQASVSVYLFFVSVFRYLSVCVCVFSVFVLCFPWYWTDCNDPPKFDFRPLD